MSAPPTASAAVLQPVVQNGHDHPLQLLYRTVTDDMVEDVEMDDEAAFAQLTACLKRYFDSGSPDEAANMPPRNFIDLGTVEQMGAAMQQVMGLHFGELHGADYCVTAFVRPPADVGARRRFYLAINHKFHDAASVGLILDGKLPVVEDVSLRVNVAKRVAETPPAPPASPSSVVHLSVTATQLADLRTKHGLKSRNECLFALSASVLQHTHASVSALQLLHNVRRQRGVQGPFFDFTSLTTAMPLPASGNSFADVCQSTQRYFDAVRAADPAVVVADSDALRPPEGRGEPAMFDTWIGAGIAAPTAHPRLEFDPALLDTFAAFLDRLVIAYELRDGGAGLAFYGTDAAAARDHAMALLAAS